MAERGRPTDYNEQTIPKTLDYLKNYKDYGDEIPSIAGLSVVLDVARNTIYDWASQEDKREFSNILQKILSEQEKTLMNNGLNGKFNSNIVKLALGKHGYSDKVDTDITTKGKELPQPLINLDVLRNNGTKEDSQSE